MRIAADRLSGFTQSLLTAGGFDKNEAKSIAESLTLSELMGHGSHGVMRIKQYIDYLKTGEVVSGAGLKTIRETPASLTIDAQKGAGQTVMPGVLQKLYDKLKTQAIVTAAICNSGHIGRLGEWVEGAAHAGYAALLLANDNGVIIHVAPPGGKQAVTSTNPIAFAFPLPEGQIFAADLSTSAIAFGKARLAQITNSRLPPGCIQDADGNPTTDPQALSTDPPGTMMPMGGAQGYKGFALSMFVDLLTAGLSGGYTPPAPPDTKYTNNVTMILWNPEFFAGTDHLKNEALKYVNFIRSSPPTDPAQPIRLAGDRMNAIRQENEANGIPLNDDLAQALLKLAKKLGVKALPELTA